MFEPEFLVYSNLAYLLPIAVLLAKSWRSKFHWAIEVSFFASVAIFSGVHHNCDTPELNHCYQPKASLYLLDVLFSYVAIAVTFSPFFTGWTRNLYHMYAIITSVFLTVFFDDAYWVALMIVVIGVVCFGLSQFTAWLTNLKEHWELLPAIGFFIAAIVFKTQSDKYDASDEGYVWSHSFWHICTAVAAAILFLDLPVVDTFKYAELNGNSGRLTNMRV